jgi:hypothetical protein
MQSNVGGSDGVRWCMYCEGGCERRSTELACVGAKSVFVRVCVCVCVCARQVKVRALWW